MSKTIIVFTTRYIEKGKLFSPDNRKNLCDIEKFAPLAAFWGKIIQEQLEGKFTKLFLSPYKEYADTECQNTPQYWNQIADKIQALNSATELAHLAALAPRCPIDERFKYIYELKNNDAENEIYALYPLPEEEEWKKFIPDINVSSLRGEWQKALKTTFTEANELYLILHGSTDYGEKGAFAIREYQTKDNKTFGLATFYHETGSDIIAWLLADSNFNGSTAQLTDLVKRLFHNEKVIKLQNLILEDYASSDIRAKYLELLELQHNLPTVDEFCKLSALDKNKLLNKILRSV